MNIKNADIESAGDKLLLDGYEYFLKNFDDLDITRFVDKILVMKSDMIWGDIEFFSHNYGIEFPKGLDKKFDINFFITNAYPYFGNYMKSIKNFNFDGVIQEAESLDVSGEYFDIKEDNAISIMMSGRMFHDFSYKQFYSLKRLLIALLFKFNLSPYDVYGVHYFNTSIDNPGFSVKKKVINYLIGIIKDFKSRNGLGHKLYFDDSVEDVLDEMRG